MELKVQGKNKYYSELLKKQVEESNGELELFFVFNTQSLNQYLNDTNLFTNLKQIGYESLNHYETLGKVIQMLGGNISLNDIMIEKKYKENDINKVLETDIRKIKERIISYSKILIEIKDEYIKEIINKYIVDYRNSLNILEMLQLKYKKNR